MRIWMDVTDFASWTGNFTGIQRIQYNIAKRFIKSGQNIGFFIYSQEQRKFVEISFDPDSPLVRQESLVKPSLINRGVKKVVRHLNQRKNIAEIRQPVHVHTPFKSNDIVLVLGGIWFGTFADDLVAAKKQSKFKLVHMVHDMIPTVYPNFVVEALPKAFNDYKRRIFSAADGLVTNSESSKKDALAFMKVHNISACPIRVFRIGEDPLVENKKTESVKELVGKPFLLSVGTIEGRKNHALLYYAYKHAAAEGIDLPPIVIAGRNGWLTEDIRYILRNDPDTKDKILIRNDISDAQLGWLYANCLFTIYPSFYEGWGMPIAESLAYGKLCLASNTSSMVEIAGKLIEYFAPSDPVGCLRLIEKYLDDAIRSKKESEISQQYKPASWDTTYLVVQDFLQKIGTAKTN